MIVGTWLSGNMRYNTVIWVDPLTEQVRTINHSSVVHPNWPQITMPDAEQERSGGEKP